MYLLLVVRRVAQVSVASRAVDPDLVGHAPPFLDGKGRACMAWLYTRVYRCIHNAGRFDRTLVLWYISSRAMCVDSLYGNGVPVQTRQFDLN